MKPEPDVRREIKAAGMPQLDAKRWRELTRFQKKLRGTTGSVTIPTADFIALMDSVRGLVREAKDAREHTADAGDAAEAATR